MKKIFCSLFLAMFLLFLASTSFSAIAVVTQTITQINPHMVVIEFDCTGHSTGGAILDTTFPPNHTAIGIKGFYLYRAIIENKAAWTNVTDDSDVYILDREGTDLLLGSGVDQLDDSTRNYLRLTSCEPIITEQLILDVDNQAVNSGAYKITLIFAK